MLAAAGVASRRQAEILILAGRVTVNGETVSLLGLQVDPTTDVIAVDGVVITKPEHRTIMLHKPSGVISTVTDPQARDTVMSLVPNIPGLHPIGRLDKDTTGLLLLTNEGDLTYALTHPKHHVNKVYDAMVEGKPNEEALTKLREGVELEDGMTAPSQVRRLDHIGRTTVLEIVIHEGRKRQIRRMCLAVGHPVVRLRRVRVGPLTLSNLPEGQWRDLTAQEIAGLYRAAGVDKTTDSEL